MSRADWDTRYLEMAKLVSTWSKDPKAKVGAVVVRNNRVVATGFNGLPSEVLDTKARLKNQNLKLNMTVHAEENALIVAGKEAEGATIYVHGKPVCCRCAGSIIQARIERVVAMSPNSRNLNPDSDWYEAGVLAERMFGEAKLNFRQFELETGKEVSDSDAPIKDQDYTVPMRQTGT